MFRKLLKNETNSCDDSNSIQLQINHYISNCICVWLVLRKYCQWHHANTHIYSNVRHAYVCNTHCVRLASCREILRLWTNRRFCIVKNNKLFAFFWTKRNIWSILRIRNGIICSRIVWHFLRDEIRCKV